MVPVVLVVGKAGDKDPASVASDHMAFGSQVHLAQEGHHPFQVVQEVCKGLAAAQDMLRVVGVVLGAPVLEDHLGHLLLLDPAVQATGVAEKYSSHYHFHNQSYT